MSGTAARRRFISPATLALVRRRAGLSLGVLLALAGAYVVLSLIGYAPSDPSFNTATAEPTHNLAGPPGATIADLLLQGFGVAGVLPAAALLAWGVRAATHRKLRLPLRLLALLLALPLLGGAIGLLPNNGAAPWPTRAGPGGAAGLLIGPWTIRLGEHLGGPAGGAVAIAILVVAAVSTSLLALGLAMRDWAVAARIAGRGGMVSVDAGRRGAGVARRLPGWLFRPWAPPADLSGLPEQAPTGWWRGLLARLRPDPLALRRTPRRPPIPPGLAPMPGTRGTPAPARAEKAAPLPPSAFAGAAPAEQTPESPAEPPAATGRGMRLLPSRAIARRPPPRQAVQQQSLDLEPTGWRTPGLDLLKAAPPRQANGPSAEALQNNARLLETVLSDYGVQGVIREIRPGPVVTLYELEPAPGIRSARVIGLADDIARSLSVLAVRIATVPGRNAIGIEVPNARRETVFLSELLGSTAWANNPSQLTLALGKDISGEPVVADLARMPHLLIAGTTGSGKSVGVNAMILSLLYRLSPDECRLILIDPKMLELSVYEGIPHLMAPVVTEPKKAVVALKWTVREMERRYRAMSQLGVRNIGGYNDRVADARAKGEVISRRVQTGFDAETGRPVYEEQPLALDRLPFIVVVIDEMADLMMVAGKEIETAVQRLAQMARAAGIHVVMATQRPSVDVITGTIKANFPTRISFQVISKFDSRTILGEQGAEQLLGQGDLLYMVGGGRITRVHGPFVADREVEDIVAFLREQGEPAYLEEVTEGEDEEGSAGAPALGGGADASLYDQAVALVAREGKASTSFVQRHLNIGYNRAAKLIEQMEKEGVVSAANHVGRREVLVRREDE